MGRAIVSGPVRSCDALAVVGSPGREGEVEGWLGRRRDRSELDAGAVVGADGLDWEISWSAAEGKSATTVGLPVQVTYVLARLLDGATEVCCSAGRWSSAC